MVLAVIRVRGRTGIKPDIAKTMELLRLTRKHHCVIISGSVTNLGMLNRCKDYVTWGDVDHDTLAALVEKRGRLSGDKRLPADMVEGVVGAIEAGQPTNIKPVFRLHPPVKGWGGMKSKWPHGALGKRDDMAALIKSMM